jgi:uncharacterized protein YjbJ (UPF0337 family)
MRELFDPLVRRLTGFLAIFFAALAIMGSSILIAEPAMALVDHHFPVPTTLGAMTNKSDAAAKDAEGKLESAYGELTGDPGHQIKGKAKQVQASAMNAAEDLKQGAKSVGKKIADATDQK